MHAAKPARMMKAATRPAKSVAELIAAPKAEAAQSKPARRECCDLLSIVLEKYGINADEFLAQSQD